MNYLYSRIENDASFRENTPLRKAFRKHLDKVIKALHDIEWVDSSDYGKGDDDAAIRECLAPGAPLESAIADVNAAIEAYRMELANIGHICSR